MADVINEVSLECPPDCLEVGKHADLGGRKSQQPNLRGPGRFWQLVEARGPQRGQVGWPQAWR